MIFMKSPNSINISVEAIPRLYYNQLFCLYFYAIHLCTNKRYIKEHKDYFV